ncbi:MAG: TRAP transporter large permease subunit [Spirochaetales bacterium]|nr:TRAP transporter large permease subunit [Spirochaetales bacterium]
MDIELICLISMLAAFLLANLLLKLPVSISMMVAAVAGALVGGQGIPVRHLFEGAFAYLDTIMTISCAMIFMTFMQESGALEALKTAIVRRFHKVPVLMLFLLTATVMFPGMITGSSTAAVLSTGALVAPVLLLMGIPKEKAGAMISMAAIMGMAAPPVNIPAMLICAGVDIPYTGFAGILFLLTVPCALICTLVLGLKYCRNLSLEKMSDGLDTGIGREYGFRLYVPAIVLVILLVVSRLVPSFPQLGTCLIFLICAFIGIFTGRRFNVWKALLSSMDDTVPILGKLMGVGMFIQVMTLVGARGWIVTGCLGLGLWFVLVSSFVVLPAFGAVNSYGAASVIGIPLLLAIQRGMSVRSVTVAAILAFLCCLGDIMPPTALAGNHAARLVGLKYRKVFAHSLLPFAICLAGAAAVLFLL